MTTPMVSTCPVCQRQQAALQPYLDAPIDRWSVQEVLAAVRGASEALHRAQCGVPPARLLLPVMLRLLMRDDLDEAVHTNLRLWMESLDRSPAHV